jgi:hypothetical protein
MIVMVPVAGSFTVSVLSAGTLWLAVFCTVTTWNGRSPVPAVAVKSLEIVTGFDMGVISTFAPENA